MRPGRDNFRYLNREGKWLDFNLSGLEVTPQGELQLLPSPRLADQSAAPPAAASAASAPHVPSGIAVDKTGRIFYSVPGENRVVLSGDCETEPRSLEGLTEGAGLGALSAPRGLLVLSQPERLLVVDSGNDRLLFFDLREFAVREVWGEGDLGSWPPPEDAPDRFHHPWSAAADGDGRNIYVLDAGNKRVLKFARTGEPNTDFLAAAQKNWLISSPRALAVTGRGADTRLFVYDLEANAIFVFDESGAPVLDSRGWPVSIRWPGMGNVLALAASESTLYVGDNDQRRILSFRLSDGFPFSGEAVGFRGHVTALAVDAPSGALLVQTGDGAGPLSLEAAGAYLGSGVLWSKAIQGAASPVAWGRLRASVVKAAGSHIEFYYAVSNDPAPPPVDPTDDDPFGDECWRALPQDVEDFLLTGDKSVYLFVGARFTGDRGATLRLKQLRADFDTENYARYLPAIYREPADRSDFLKRLVSLFQGLFEDIEDEANALERYFDTSAAPSEGLAWLATWLAVELSEDEPEARMRESIARAFRRYQWRGTIEGLRLALLEDAGVHATISEPIAASSFWAMPRAADCGGGQGLAPSQLGTGMHLTSTEPGGAVLGMTATLDHSYLITDAQFGEPLFEGAAWQFIVEVYRGEVSSEARLQTVKEIIEREKPAHTMYRLVVLDSMMRAGAQARAGVDTLVGGTGGPTALGQGGDGFGLRLGGPLPPRIGASRLGEELKL